MHNYVVSAQKPTAVLHSCTGNFTSPTDINLIMGKCTMIELCKITEEGVVAMMECPIYGRISAMQLFRLPGATQDSLLILTERCQIIGLNFDMKTQDIVTIFSGDLQDKIGRPVESGQIAIVDPQSKLIAAHLYEGLLKILPFEKNNTVAKEAFNVRLEEMNVVDLKFIEGVKESASRKKTDLPLVAVLHQDPKGSRHVKTYYINPREKELVEGPYNVPNVEAGAVFIIPAPEPFYGIIIVGEQQITYHDGSNSKSKTITPSVFRAYGKVDKMRWILGDSNGNLYMLELKGDESKKTIQDIVITKLGQTSIASTISYLDAGHIFVGSMYGDSHEILLRSEKSEEDGSFFEIVSSYTNLSPIVDFCIVDLEKQGQGQVVSCSGALKDGSLRIIRNGIGIEEHAKIDMEGVKGLWSIKESLEGSQEKAIILTFIGETRALGFDEDGDLGEITIDGLATDKPTLYVANVEGTNFIQVTESSVRLINSQTFSLVTEYVPNKTIHLASASPTQILLSLGQGNILYLEIKGNKIVEVKSTKLEYEVSCLDIHPLGNENTSTLCAVGMWTDISVRILKVPTLEPLNKEELGVEILPRSVLFSTFENVNYVLCALGDGHLFQFKLDKNTGKLTEKKKVSLGTKPVLLTPFTSKGNKHVFASSDRPTVIYSHNQKLLYSNVNLKEVSFMCPFSSENSPEGLAIAKEGSLMLGTIDEIQKLHIRTIPLGEQPRRIAYQETTNTFAVATVRLVKENVGEVEQNFVRLIDAASFEFLHEIGLNATEFAASLISCKFMDDNEYYVVGTAFVNNEEDEPSKGRIIIYEVKNKKLTKVGETEVKGCVYCMTPFNGKLLTGINSKVQLWKVADSSNSNEDKDISLECSHSNNIIVLSLQTRGDFIVVGDLMKSISLLTYKPVDGSIEQLARDFNANWITATQILDDDTYIGAENAYNLFTVTKNTDAATEEERRKLNVSGQFHLGDMVNKMRHGSLVMKIAESETNATSIPTVVYGTVNGSIGVIAQIPKEKYDFFLKVQQAISQVIKGLGGLSHENWRSFLTERRKEKANNFLDGDLIESYADLKRDKQQNVISILKNEFGEKELSVEELTKRIEELSSSLH